MPTTSPGASPRAVQRPFDHVLIIVFENQYRGYVMENPYMRRLAEQGIDLAGYSGVMHPSQTNYVAAIAGELCNVTGDDPCDPLLEQRTVVDLLEDAGLSWKAYMESYVEKAQPWSPELMPGDMHPYYVKHNPFGSFASIVRSEQRWARVQNEAALFADLLNGTFPSYAWFSPNTWSDGHWVDGTSEESDPRAPALVDQAARWLEGFFGRLRFPGPDSHLPPRTLVVVMFDEADYEAAVEPGGGCTYDGPNQVYAVLLGDMIEPGVEEEGYNHYSLLRTIEENFGLGSLGKNDAGASYFQFLWGRRFRWSAPVETPLAGAQALAAAGLSGAVHVVCSRDGALSERTFTSGTWSEEQPIDARADAVALAAAGGRLILVSRDAAGNLQSRERTPEAGWRVTAEIVVAGPVKAFALAAMPDGERAMLVWRSEHDHVYSSVYSDGRWHGAVAVVGNTTDGELALCALGTSLYLVFQRPGGAGLDLVSYNTAPFNAVSVPDAPQNDTTVDAWSPSSFPVAHFSACPDPRTPGEPEPQAETYAARGPLAAAAADGVLRLFHPAVDSPRLTTTTFSLAGLMTPARPVSARGVEAPDRSNGHGTPAEAGWGPQSSVPGAAVGPGCALAAAADGGTIFVLFQPEAGGPVRMIAGRYAGEEA